MKNVSLAAESRSLKNMGYLGLILGLMYLIFLNPHIDVRGFNAHDPASYIARTSALWQGHGYGEKFANIFLPVTAQPIGFSLLLVPIVGILGVNFVALKLFMVLIAVFCAVSLYYFFKYFLASREKAVTATLLLMASPVIFGLSHRVLADIPLYLLTALGLWRLDVYLRKPVSFFSVDLWVAGILIGAAYLMKQTAVGIIFGGWFLWVHPLFRNRTVFLKLIFYTFVSFIPILAWQYWDSRISNDLWYWTTPAARDFIYLDPFHPKEWISISDFLVRMRHNLIWGMSGNLAAVLIAPFYFLEGQLIGFLLSLPVAVWLLWGWGKSYLKMPSVLEGFVFFSLALLLVKHLGMAERYIALVYPAVLVYAFRNVNGLSKTVQNFLFSLSLILAFSSTFVTALDQWRNPYGSKTLKDYVSIAEQAQVRFSDKPSCIAPLLSHWQILTGHVCFYYQNNAELHNLSRSAGYIVGLSSSAPLNIESFQDVERDVLSSASKLSQIAENDPNQFEKIYENSTLALYQVKT